MAPVRFYSEGSGATVLIEEHTATYCQTCAQIDPVVINFLEENGNRAVRWPSTHLPTSS